jgi:putative toxin-antitoxin system antitoxin component (TIGR02293 family)
MLTTEDKDEIKRIIVETFATSGQSFSGEHRRADEIDQFDKWLNMVVNEGFTELAFINPKTGEKRVVEAKLVADSIIDVTARAIEVFGTREQALRWLKTPVRSLGDHTPLSLLKSAEGVAQVQDTLGRVEHGVW